VKDYKDNWVTSRSITTTEIVTAHVAHNSVSTKDLPNSMQTIHAALSKRGMPVEAEEPVRKQTPAVSIRSSLGQII
jgi:predicted transcriptional regulator